MIENQVQKQVTLRNVMAFRACIQETLKSPDGWIKDAELAGMRSVLQDLEFELIKYESDEWVSAFVSYDTTNGHLTHNQWLEAVAYVLGYSRRDEKGGMLG